MKRTHLPLNGLRVLDAAARHLSFTKAADELAVTPAAVGQQIRALGGYAGRGAVPPHAQGAGADPRSRQGAGCLACRFPAVRGIGSGDAIGADFEFADDRSAARFHGKMADGKAWRNMVVPIPTCNSR